MNAVVSIERRQLEICELLFEIPLSADSNVSGCHTSNVFAAFVEYITKKNVGMLRNVQPAGMSGMNMVATSLGCRRSIAVLASILLIFLGSACIWLLKSETYLCLQIRLSW